MAWGHFGIDDVLAAVNAHPDAWAQSAPKGLRSDGAGGFVNPATGERYPAGSFTGDMASIDGKFVPVLHLNGSPFAVGLESGAKVDTSTPTWKKVLIGATLAAVGGYAAATAGGGTAGTAAAATAPADGSYISDAVKGTEASINGGASALSAGAQAAGGFDYGKLAGLVPTIGSLFTGSGPAGSNGSPAIPPELSASLTALLKNELTKSNTSVPLYQNAAALSNALLPTWARKASLPDPTKVGG